ncbi:globin domain-containing protein [Deinococcus cellulosilyticus]|uniref:Hemoglobin n=1 Tax=Deinococcus cellulosilyticus (strain DSM 18568 / NBRC 106333 / KACC 11606 / 5516J-15) TaxID=1223518 RepID=A0A511MV95_DEIC1|nr:globin domain-containing protein [Deinococcus cellulosilyticus]GEM44500.1 hemoglobin [Deinococcus cellulosilyticus NBRC 106333 = KACC 11606]
MAFTSSHVALIRRTFEELIPHDLEMEVFFGDIFYQRLFAQHPELKPLFHTDIAEQAHRLVTMLRWMVEHLSSIDEFQTEVKALGERHVKYGILPEHYNHVGEALIWVFQQTLGEDFTEEVATAWKETFLLISETMRGEK